MHVVYLYHPFNNYICCHSLFQNHADMEWKFTRSKLWMGYFDQGSTLPPPFNLIISPKSVVYVVTAIKEMVCKCCPRRKKPIRRRQKSFDGNIKVCICTYTDVTISNVYMCSQLSVSQSLSSSQTAEISKF